MNDRHSERGNALLVALLVVVAMAGLAAALMMTSYQDSKRSRAEGEQTQVLYVTEAGVNHSIADITSGGSGNVGSSSTAIPFGGGSYHVAAVDNGDGTYTLTAQGELGDEMQAVEVVIAPIITSPFRKAMFGDIDLGAAGNVFTDSYDSDVGTYGSQVKSIHAATGRPYANANGSLGSNADITLRGGVIVMGDATPGPGHSVTISGTGVIVTGSTAPAPEAVPMPPVSYSPSIPSSGSYDPSTCPTTFGTGEYRYSDLKLSSKTTLTFTGDVDLYVDGDLTITAQAAVVVSSGGSLTIHHGSGTLKLTGQGVLNDARTPDALQVYSSSTDVEITGNGDLYGAVYAPNAKISPTGTSVIYGSLIGREVYISGTTDFHYDEALARATSTSSGRMRVVSWRVIGVSP